MRIVVVDIETRKLAEELSENKSFGWQLLKAGEGGISGIVIYDSIEKWPFIYDDHSIIAAGRHLENADLVVTYFGEKFDISCIEGVLGRKLALREHLDLYTLIAKTNAKQGIFGKKGDYTLDSVCKRTIGRGKSGTGSHAPQLAREGRFGELFNYCSNDVRLTWDLLKHICTAGGIVNHTYGFLELHVADQIKQAVIECTALRS